MTDYNSLIKQVKYDLNEEKALLDSCLLFIDKIASAHNKSQFDYISLNLLSQITKENDQKKLLQLSNYLSDTRINILSLCFYYFSLSSDRQEPIEVDIKVVNEALQSNVFYDPETGKQDCHFRKNLKMYFSLTDDGRSLNVSS